MQYAEDNTNSVSVQCADRVHIRKDQNMDK